MFSANRGGPRFVDFLPDGNLLVGSGQTYGGFEVMTPFDDAVVSGAGHNSSFFQPELHAGESMTMVNVHEGELHIGTSYGRVLQYGLANYDKTMHSAAASTAKEPLDMPAFVPPPPKLSIDPTVLCSSSNDRTSMNDSPMPGWNVFDSYILASNPLLSSDKALLHPRYSRSAVKATTLGPMSNKALVAPSKRWLSKGLQAKLDSNATPSAMRSGLAANPGDADFVRVFPTADLDLNDLMEPTASSVEEESGSSLAQQKEGSYKGKNFDPNKATKKMRSFPNPNKFLYSTENFATCYDATVSRQKLQNYHARQSSDQLPGGEEDLIEGEENGIPRRYRLTVRPPFYKVTSFDYQQYNDTGVFVGWDYAPTFANSFACSVLTLLYFVKEIREMALRLQLLGKDLATMVGKNELRDKGKLVVFQVIVTP